MSSFLTQFRKPEVTLTDNPIINALFGGVVMGVGIGFALKSSISMVDGYCQPDCSENRSECRAIFPLLSMGLLCWLRVWPFGWGMRCTPWLPFFIAGWFDAVFTKQKRMQAMIITKDPDRVIDKIHKQVASRGDSDPWRRGTYNREQKPFCRLLPELSLRIQANHEKYGSNCLLLVADNVHILGLFVEEWRYSLSLGMRIV